MSYSCIGCGEAVKKKVEFKVFTHTPMEYCCEKCKKSLPKIFSKIKNKSLEIIGKNERINSLFDQFIITDKNTNLKENNGNSKYAGSSLINREHMFSLLEETHRFAYHASFECFLFCQMFEKAEPYFFSERYFLTNSIIKTIGAWEKILRFHCIYYEVSLNSDPKKNSLVRLRRKMSQSGFKDTQLFIEYNILKSHNKFSAVDEARKNNDHNLSFHLSGKNFKTLSKLAEDILENLVAIYNGIEEAISLLEQRTRLVTKNQVQVYGFSNKVLSDPKVIKKKLRTVKTNFSPSDIKDFNDLSVGYIEWANQRFEEVMKWKITFSNPPLNKIYYKLVDVTVRIHESARSIGYATEMFRTATLQSYQDLDNLWVRFNGMNYRYFIHSALIRMYSVYDKLGMILQDLFELELGDVTFEGVLQYLQDPKNEDRYINSLPPIKKCNYIISTLAYKRLYNSRQDFFHLLVKQDFMTVDYKEVVDYELMIAIIENSKMIYDLIESLDTALTHFHAIGTYHLNTKG
ncbi:Cthe_2314 family HEPN domain-containing protein [Paenibacillus polymyxa]|uniref:Cthe_2314 family HEPN domain-containing protein n=1 Tax=Paenibacillus polymyxa TaxID=1406 RepID=UPI000589CE22|nr:Cthe_2314 family HEPN domain-containing protein [Paenibacillus polymyxa]AJE54295.1 hypothetical protein RE92_25260 [Paenibacillus polymyxa]